MTKKIEAIIREEKLNDVKDALNKIGIIGMNAAEIRGHGREGGIELLGRSGAYKVDMLPKIQLSIILSDHNVEKAVKTVCEAARTGEPGDGMIFIYPVEDVIRIRTGERGRDALHYAGDIDERRGEAAGETNGRINGTAMTQSTRMDVGGLRVE